MNLHHAGNVLCLIRVMNMANETRRQKAIKARGQMIVKANDLIRKTRYDLSVQQQKLVLYCISKIKPNDKPDMWYEISIADICQACNLDLDGGGRYYRIIKDDLQKLTNRLWVQMPDKTERTASWISDAIITPYSGTVKIRFHEAMEPYLFQLRQQYTMYHLEDVLVLRGKHAIRLFELLRSYTTQKAIDEGQTRKVVLPLQELRELLAVPTYPRWADFDRFVIRKAADEINACNADLHIDYRPIRAGHNVAQVEFTISSPRALQALSAIRKRKERLGE